MLIVRTKAHRKKERKEEIAADWERVADSSDDKGDEGDPEP